MKKKLRQLFVRLFARKAFQPFFKQLHWIALRGMNYGGGHSPKDSGEVFFLNYIKQQTQNTITILDIGANRGQYALLANTILNKNCSIFSFEPTKFTYDKLKKSTEAHPNIIPIHKGIGDTIGQTEIYYNVKGSVQSSILKDGSSEHSETITLTTIDQFCIETNIQKVDLIKLDVEGYEYNALIGGLETINTVDYIQFEFGNKQVDNRNFLIDFIKLLKDFNIYRLVQNGFIPIDSNPIHEIFQTSNYIAINKRLL